MKLTRILGIISLVVVLVSCGGTKTKKQAEKELNVRVTESVEGLKYLDQISDKLIEARVWEVEHKKQILALKEYVLIKKVPQEANLALLPDSPALIDARTLTKDKLMSTENHNQLMEALDVYYASQKEYAEKVIALSHYFTNKEFRKDRFKKGELLVNELNEATQNYKNKGIAAWKLVQQLQQQTVDHMAGSPLQEAYLAATVDVSSYRMVIDLLLNYADGQGELNDAVVAFNQLLEVVRPHRSASEQALQQLGKKAAYDQVYVEIYKGMRTLKELIVALQDLENPEIKVKKPVQIDRAVLQSQFEAIHQAYQNFLAV